MALTRDLVESRAREYRDEEPLYAVESEQIETLPGAFEAGTFGWRDAAWVVRWFYRRHLGAFPDDRRRAAEDAFGENDLETIRAVIADVVASDETADQLNRLMDLAGVDVPVGSAFLQFIDPARYLVIGEREWAALVDAGEFSRPYPDPPTVEAYEGYLDTAREIAERIDCDLWTIYRALWRLGQER